VLYRPITQREFAAIESWRGPDERVAYNDASGAARGALPKRAFEHDDIAAGLGQRQRTRQSCNAGADYGVLGARRELCELWQRGRGPGAGVKKRPRDGNDCGHVISVGLLKSVVDNPSANRRNSLARSLLQSGHSPWTEDTVDGNPFGSIESAQEYLRLLAEAVQEAQLTFPEDVVDSVPLDEQTRARRLQAMQLVSYKLSQLADHVNGSRSVLNDLRMLRRLLLRERALGVKSMKSVRSTKS
jgi:hypothetical protein